MNQNKKGRFISQDQTQILIDASASAQSAALATEAQRTQNLVADNAAADTERAQAQALTDAGQTAATAKISKDLADESKRAKTSEQVNAEADLERERTLGARLSKLEANPVPRLIDQTEGWANTPVLLLGAFQIVEVVFDDPLPSTNYTLRYRAVGGVALGNLKFEEVPNTRTVTGFKLKMTAEKGAATVTGQVKVTASVRNPPT